MDNFRSIEMVPREGSTSSLGLQLLLDSTLAHISTSIVLVLIASIVIVILNILTSILEPMNYRLDMTSKDFCRPLAEIDNNLKFKRGENNELNTISNNVNDQHRALNCATDLLNAGSETRSQIDSNNNNSSDTINTSVTHTGSGNHVYPNGWIPVMESHKVEPGCLRKAIILGRDVIITRSANDNQVSVLDAYCPHMGVHIGIGGQVKLVENQSCVECPFHGWTFRASDGQCVRIPYQKSGSKCGIPKQAKLGTWTCAEVDNFIYIWYHIDDQPPSWFLTPSEELKSKDWQLAGRSCHKTNLELRDMHENGADMNHFEGIHNDLFILGGQITKLRPLNYLQQYTRHHWLPDWKPVLNDLGKMTHMAEMKLQSWITLFGFRLFDITVRANQIGPARVNLYYNSKWYGKGLLIMNAIPMGGRRTKYIQHIYTQRTLFQCFMAKWVLYGEIKQLERDFFIWNHKKNLKNPIFIPEDRTLKQFRLWYSQFYKRKRKISIHDLDNEVISNDKTAMTLKNHIDF